MDILSNSKFPVKFAVLKSVLMNFEHESNLTTSPDRRCPHYGLYLEISLDQYLPTGPLRLHLDPSPALLKTYNNLPYPQIPHIHPPEC